MATYDSYAHRSSSQRGVAMVLAMVSAVVLSPLYVDRGKAEGRYYETRWSSGGLVLPAVLVGLIVAIKTASSVQGVTPASIFLSTDSSSVFRIGTSSWGLAGILIMLIFVLSWQSSLQHYFWR